MTDTELLALKETIATDVRLPKELAVRLKGSTPEEIKKDAYELKRMLGIKTAPPLAGYDPPHAYDNIEDVKLNTAYRDVLSRLRSPL